MPPGAVGLDSQNNWNSHQPEPFSECGDCADGEADASCCLEAESSPGLHQTLNPDSPALELGFEPIPIDKIGALQD